MSELAEALDRSRDMIEAALASARAELAELDARRSTLEALIAQAEVALGGGHAPTGMPTMTLHEAIAQTLRDNGNAPMTARALAAAINERGLYRTRDGSPVEVNQVHARTSNYQELFDKDGPLIRLKEESPMPASHYQTVAVSADDLPNWKLILDAARALTAAGQAPFTRISVYEWIWRRYPREQHDRPSLDPTFQGMIKNATGGPTSAGGTPLVRVKRGHYRLAD